MRTRALQQCIGTVALAASLIYGCSSGESGSGSSEGTTGGGPAAGGSPSAGGGGTATGGSADETGSGGGVFGHTRTEACIAYAQANCQKHAECQGQTSAYCLGVTFSCPDLIFSPGSSRTIEEAFECAEAYARLTCAELDAGVLPPCVSPGTLPLGEPCAYSSQCASLFCQPFQDCGTCIPDAELGEPCVEGVYCASGLICDQGYCVPFDSIPTRPGPGEPCTGGFACVRGHYCDLPSGSTTGTCRAFPGVGESCERQGDCALDQDIYCELDSLICRPLPSAGEPCGVDAWTGRASYCAEGLGCLQQTASSGTCVPLPETGEPCLLQADGSGPQWPQACAADLSCDTSLSPPQCTLPRGPGAPCTPSVVCEEGLWCMCDDTECSSSSCRILRLASEPCDAPADRCHPGMTCQNGICQTLDSQGHFERACGE